MLKRPRQLHSRTLFCFECPKLVLTTEPLCACLVAVVADVVVTHPTITIATEELSMVIATVGLFPTVNDALGHP